MFNLLTSFGFPEISIIFVLSIAALILLTLNIAFIVYRTTKKVGKKSASKALSGEQDISSEKDAGKRKDRGGIAVLPPAKAPKSRKAPVQRGNGANGQGNSGLIVLPPIVLPPLKIPGVFETPRQNTPVKNGQRTGANRQGNRGPVVLPPIVLGVPDLRAASPTVQDPRNAPAPTAMPQTQQRTPLTTPNFRQE